MKLLFICNQNQNRSKTAEELFKSRFTTKSAGLFNERPVSENEIAWVDLICVMTGEQRVEIAARFPKQYIKKQIISLDIPVVYHYYLPELVELLNERVNELI